jgi:transcriptional regulator with XRE-family HTH domain
MPASDMLASNGFRASARATLADHHVGRRIRERRTTLGMSQQQMASLIGVTCQQAHKYERGANRIAAGRLYGLSLALGVPIAWFFEGLDQPSEPETETPRQRMCLEVARNFAAIENERHQAALSNMTRALAGSGTNIE